MRLRDLIPQAAYCLSAYGLRPAVGLVTACCWRLATCHLLSGVPLCSLTVSRTASHILQVLNTSFGAVSSSLLLLAELLGHEDAMEAVMADDDVKVLGCYPNIIRRTMMVLPVPRP